jgi:hypothetical protein
MRNDATDDDQRAVVTNSFYWLTQQPSARPHWQIQRGLLCTLTDD